MNDVLFLDRTVSYWAVRQPNAVAAAYGGREYTYIEFETRVNELAACLTEAGVGRGHCVGIYAAKSFDTLCAIYATLRSGAAYVPIDPAAPLSRVEVIVTNSRLEVVFADPSKLSAFEGTWLEETVKLPIDISRPLEIESNLIDLSLPKEEGSRKPDDLAYILYTSGSTGVPKGICHTHVSGLAYANMSATLCELSPMDRVSNFTSMHFDMSIFDVFSTAVAGGCVVIIPEIVSKMPASLSQFIQNEKISVLYLVPFALAQLAERGALEDRDLSLLRIVMFAGERILPSQLKQFAEFVPSAQFFNAYGPTETNHCTTRTYSYSEIDGVAPIDIGHASDGVSALIWDDGPCEEGELLIASRQVMTGYLNAPDRTNRAFLEIEHDGVPTTFYRTGDIVRRLNDGSFDLVGRVDRQVKVRGFRVELDEIELVISNHKSVGEVAAVFDTTSNTILAFVSMRQGYSLSEAELKNHCAEALPSYAVPTHIETVPTLSRTSTGKLDRKALMDGLDGR